MQGFIFDIKRYAVNDGPGIRTTVFLKGCPLRCPWCHNPESQSTKPEQMPVKRKLGDNVFDDIQNVGYNITPEQLLEQVLKDFVFFDESGGGVTFSGGEPLMQQEFLIQCLKLCNDNNINTCIDTAGTVKLNNVEQLLRLTDIFLFDIKTLSKEKFVGTIGTQAQFDIIYQNLLSILPKAKRTIIRIPVIPDFNDDKQSIDQIIEFLKQFPNVREVSLLPFHRTGADKYRRLGRQWNMGNTKNLTEEDISPIKQQFIKANFNIFET